MQKTLYILLLAAVLVAGCASGDTTVAQNRELLRISSLTVTPGTVVSPGETMTVRMKLDNVGQEDVKFVNTKTSGGTTTDAPIANVDGLYNILYDTCTIYKKSDKVTPIVDGFTTDNSYLVLKPGNSAILEWTIGAPSETQIANMQHECNFKFQISYKALAKTYTYVYFANPDEKNQRIYTNKDMNLRGENIANFGPVYINFETAQEQPIKGKPATGDSAWTFYVTAKNIGEGIGRITDGTLAVQLPNKEFTKSKDKETSEDKCKDFGDITGPDDKKTMGVANDDGSRLKLYSKQSSRFSCTLAAPNVGVLEPYRFISSADYTYSVDKTIKILTNPKR